MSFGGRLSVVLGLLIVVIGFAVWGVVGFLLPQPATVDFTSASAGAPIDMTVQTVPAIGFGFQPVWVSYLVKNQQGQWIHSTIWQLPAHTRINVTIEQYDSGSPLRNQQWGRVQGTIGGQATYNGKPISVYDSNTGQRGRPHLHHPGPQPQRAPGRRERQRHQHLRSRSLLHQLRPQHHEVLVRDPGPG